MRLTVRDAFARAADSGRRHGDGRVLHRLRQGRRRRRPARRRGRRHLRRDRLERRLPALHGRRGDLLAAARSEPERLVRVREHVHDRRDGAHLRRLAGKVAGRHGHARLLRALHGRRRHLLGALAGERGRADRGAAQRRRGPERKRRRRLVRPLGQRAGRGMVALDERGDELLDARPGLRRPGGLRAAGPRDRLEERRLPRVDAAVVDLVRRPALDLEGGRRLRRRRDRVGRGGLRVRAGPRDRARRQRRPRVLHAPGRRERASEPADHVPALDGRRQVVLEPRLPLVGRGPGLRAVRRRRAFGRDRRRVGGVRRERRPERRLRRALDRRRQDVRAARQPLGERRPVGKRGRSRGRHRRPGTGHGLDGRQRRARGLVGRRHGLRPRPLLLDAAGEVDLEPASRRHDHEPRAGRGLRDREPRDVHGLGDGPGRRLRDAHVGLRRRTNRGGSLARAAFPSRRRAPMS